MAYNLVKHGVIVVGNPTINKGKNFF